MSGDIASGLLTPHRFWSPHAAPQNSSPFNNSNMSGKKRKADDELDLPRDRMSTSPSPTPAAIPLHNSPTLRRHTKRLRTNISSKSLSLPRLLETLSADEMRNVIRSICDRHPDIGAEIVTTAPRPSVSSALAVLTSYQAILRESFPYGDRPSSEYSYNRVRQALMNLLDALKDYTPHFLPPNEPHPATSLAFLDGATDIIHRLPSFDSFQHDRHKAEAYEEISRAWALAIKEAAKKAGGIQIQYGGWDEKLVKHNEISGGKMADAVRELQTNLGWIGGGITGTEPGTTSADSMSIREQLMAGTYGKNLPIQVGPGPW